MINILRNTVRSRKNKTYLFALTLILFSGCIFSGCGSEKGKTQLIGAKTTKITTSQPQTNNTHTVKPKDPHSSSASFFSVCDRTPAVQKIIIDLMKRSYRWYDGLPIVDTCDKVTENHLRRYFVLFYILTDVVSLKSRDFEGLTDVRDLSILSEQLSTVPPGLLNGLTALREIAIKFSKASSLPLGLFNGLTSVTKIDISYNEFNSLPPGLFSGAGLTSLKELNVLFNNFNEDEKNRIREEVQSLPQNIDLHI